MLSFSAQSSQESSGHTMLLSAAPAGIRHLAECYDSRPSLPIQVEDLDKIFDGKYENLKGLEGDIVFKQYLREYFPALEWWIKVTRALAYRQFDDGSGSPGDLNWPFEEEKNNLLKLLNAALSLYAPSLEEDMNLYHLEFSSVEYGCAPTSVEFLKRYRLYTRAVCAVAQKCWPDHDLGWLLQQG